MKKLLNSAQIIAVLMALILTGSGTLLSAPAGVRDERKAGDVKTGEAGEAEAAKPRVFGIEAGYNGSYAEGSAPKSFFSQPYVNIYLSHTYVKFTAGISRFWNYQIANGAGGYENVNVTQPKIALSIYPYRSIELYGEYRYWTGDRSHYYRAHDGTGGLNFDFEAVSFGFTGNYKKTDYKFYSDDRKDTYSLVSDLDPPWTIVKRLTLLYRYGDFRKQNTKHLVEYTLTPAFSWHIIESTSLDLGYEYYYTDFKNPYPYKNLVTLKTEKITYYSHTGRLGVSSETCRFFSLSAGVTAGRGSDRYILVGGDIEGVVNLFDYASLSAAYAPVYSIAPPMDPATRKFLEFRSYLSLFRALRGARLNVNPYVRLKDIGKSFWNHGVTFNVSVRY